ncbi:MAG: 3-dehydroquinate synthase [Nitrospirae bacterium]|nr:3-dehydroquinate synthase [Nitrospirota bacterium]
MRKVRVDLGQRSYDICIGHNSMSGLARHLKTLPVGKKGAIITNPVLSKLYGESLSRHLSGEGYKITTIELPAGERYKTLKSVSRIYDILIEEKFERNSFIIALGGGVIGDVAGFAAATFLRGIPYIQVPTSLLAQVDSSVGGKTGVDHRLGKNLIGAFYQPCLVWIDVDVLKTLPRRELTSGMGEVVKYGVIADEQFFNYIQDNFKDILLLNEDMLIHTVARSCEIKAMVVSSDEREAGLRAILNFGHTMGHAVETITGYRKYRHGEAVAMGMVFAARLAVNMGLCGDEVAASVERLCRLIGLKTELPVIQLPVLTDILGRDKKVADGKVRFVLPVRIGEVKIVENADSDLLQRTLQLCYTSNKSEE